MSKPAMSRVGRVKENSQTQGFMKVLVNAESEQILGAASLGLDGDEAIHDITDNLYELPRVCRRVYFLRG